MDKNSDMSVTGVTGVVLGPNRGLKPGLKHLTGEQSSEARLEADAWVDHGLTGHRRRLDTQIEPLRPAPWPEGPGWRAIERSEIASLWVASLYSLAPPRTPR